MRLFAESFIAWRYLVKRRSRGTLAAFTLVAFLVAVAVQIALFAGGQVQLGAILTLPTVLLFVTSLLLNFFSAFTAVSVIGVLLGVAALTVVLSVTSGFQREFRQKILGVNAHVLVMKYGLMHEYHEVTKKVLEHKRVKAAAPFVFNEMIVAHGPITAGVLLKGIDPVESPKVLDIADRLEKPAKPSDLYAKITPSDGNGPPLPAIFVGKELAKKLKVKVGDRLRVVSPKLDVDALKAGNSDGPMAREFRVAGVFYSGFDEYDRRLAYVNLPDAQAFYDTPDVVNGVEMKLDSVDAADEVAHDLLRALGGPPYRVIDWEELNHNLFTALKMQKFAIVIFLAIIIVVAAFNIVAAMTMLVVEKTREIAILKSMGMSSARIARVFQVAGLTIGGVGVLAGVGLGLLCCAVVARYGYALDTRVYLIDKLPVDISVVEILVTVAATLAICFLATVYPALKGASLRPADGLRYE
jgi:lipoprotein-releasing system permease protein